MNPALLKTIAQVAASVGAPVIGNILRKRGAGAAGNIAERVVEEIGAHLGKAPADIPAMDTPALREAVKVVEADAAELILAQTAQLEASHRLQLAEMDKGHWFAWGWRPATMWLIGFLWGWALFLHPVAVAAGVPVPPLDYDTFMAFSTVYSGLYMGGHTVKRITGR